MINDNNKDSWCVNAFHAMSGNNDGTTKICCMIQQGSRTAPSTTKGVIASDRIPILGNEPIDEHFNRPLFTNVRNALSRGIKHQACTNCWQEESAGRKSKRQRDNERYLHEMKWDNRKEFVGLTKVELNLGNMCNIKCRTCHPAISSQWMKEYYDVYESDNHTYSIWADTMKKYYKSYDDSSSFWPDIESHLSTIKQFDFYGGEPFLSKKMWHLLKCADDQGYAKEIELHYNTNGTTWPDEQIKAWPSFKKVNLSFSIDGTDAQFEYMRYPAKWDIVKTNIDKARAFRDKYGNMHLSWCITLSTLNIYNLPEILDEYYKNYSDMGIYLNLVHGPKHYNINILPDAYKAIIIKRLEAIPKEYESVWHQLPGIINFMEAGTPDTDAWALLFKTTALHDAYREQKFNQVFPEYGNIIEYKDNK